MKDNSQVLGNGRLSTENQRLYSKEASALLITKRCKMSHVMRMHFVSFTYKEQRRISADSAGVSAPWLFATLIVRVISLVSSCLFLGMDNYC